MDILAKMTQLAGLFAGISLGMAGLLMAGQWLAPELAQQYKRQIPDIIRGLVLLGLASAIVSALGYSF